MVDQKNENISNLISSASDFKFVILDLCIEPSRGKTNNVVSDRRSDTNRAVQAQKQARSLKFRI